MTQLHAVRRGLGVTRPTNDIDIVLHIETSRGIPDRTASALESIGYTLSTGIDPRNQTAHRFVRGASSVDLLTSGNAREEERATKEEGPGTENVKWNEKYSRSMVKKTSVRKKSKDSEGNSNLGDGAANVIPGAGRKVKGNDVVDVLVAEHAAPSVHEPLRGRAMVKAEGATQALRRTVNAVVEITPGRPIVLSVPNAFGAVILKAAAYRTDSRDRDRHLYDAATLLACIDDPYAERKTFAGSDRARLLSLQRALVPGHGAWAQLPSEALFDAQATLSLLCAS